PLRPLLADTQVVDLRADPEDGYARLWRGMRGTGLDPADSFAWEGGRAPYPGLAPFQAADAAVYFGREEEQRRCLDALAQMRRYGGERLLVVVGASGCGKSSLVRAGVLPRVARMPDWRVLGPMRPLRRPDEELARVLAAAQAPPGQSAAGQAPGRSGERRNDGGDAAVAAATGDLRAGGSGERRDEGGDAAVAAATGDIGAALAGAFA